METTLCLIYKGDKILLAEKKRGFGKGKINSAGGKLELNETPEQAVIREIKEELGIDLINPEKRAVIWFDTIYKGSRENYPCHVFVADRWTGEPMESDEMKPMWFDINNLPYEKMFSDDKLWLERVLAGEKLECKFKFDDDFNLIEYKIENIKEKL